MGRIRSPWPQPTIRKSLPVSEGAPVPQVPQAEPRTWTPAAFYQEDDERLLCTLCPHACRLEDGATGLCGVRRRREGVLETATHASCVRHLDPVEKKPLYHYRPGTRALTLAAPGCSFTCHYCLNYRLSQYGRVPDAAWRAAPVDAAAIVAEAARQAAAVALSYSEPSLAAELTLELAAAAGPCAVDVLWKSNGFLTPAAVDVLAPCLAAVNVDVKSLDEKKHRALTGAPAAPVIETLARFAAADVWVEVSTPVIPGVNDDDGALRRIAQAIREVSADVPWHLVRFIPEFRMRRSRPTPVDVLRRAVDVGREAGLRYIYVERALGQEGRTTRCPDCDVAVVRRGVWTTEDVLLRGGACPGCELALPGRW
ncbi:MAG: AmmeMemoRadiSam system radical SAM enzyme [bacterium]|nr:AmmeMemoRadiSam system radical SAM enzyme [bacterium]